MVSNVIPLHPIKRQVPPLHKQAALLAYRERWRRRSFPLPDPQ